MQLQTSALFKIKDLVEAILSKMNEISKPSGKFFSSITDTWFVVPVRYTFTTQSRYGDYCDKSLRLHFERGFDFLSYKRLLIKSKCGKELIGAFDPGFVHKSGKKTAGLSWFWSGKDQRSLKGLEMAGLAIVDVAARTAIGLCAVQTQDDSFSIFERKTGNLFFKK